MESDDHKPFIIRSYRASDREAVRKLCCDTGFLGDPINPVYEDRQLFADFLTAYYTDHEPESCFLLEVDGEFAVTFLARASRCATNSTRFIRMFGSFFAR